MQFKILTQCNKITKQKLPSVIGFSLCLRFSRALMCALQSFVLLLLFFFIPSGVKIPRVKSKVKSKRKAEVVTPIIIIIS